MFTGVTGIIDENGRPVFVVPVDLPAEGCRICVTDTALEFFSGVTHVGHVEENIDDAILLLVLQQKEVGLISWPSEKTPCPDYLTHIAVVEDKRTPMQDAKKSSA